MELPNTERPSRTFRKRFSQRQAWYPYELRYEEYQKRMEDGISIFFDDPPNSKFYRSGSAVKGTVKLQYQGFSSLSIELICESSARRDYSYEIWHRLLDLDMSIDKSALPGPDYTIPFSFVIPDQHEACSHEVDDAQTRHLHSYLPPAITGLNRDCKRAMLSEGVRIDYNIIVTLWWDKYTQRKMERPIHVLPRFIEQPLPAIPNGIQTFKMRATQQLKSGFFLGSTGQITLSVDPPTTHALAVGGGSLPPIDITGLLNLEFLKGKPVLPQSYTFSAKLESQTWSQPVPMQQLPEIQKAKNCHSVSEVLARNTEMKLFWERSVSEEANTAASPSAKGFSAQIKASIPAFSKPERVFLPTFYSCLIARTYLLHFTIIIASVPLRLVLPLQLSVEDEESAWQCESSSTEVSGSDTL
ncbi:hypothetical protein FAUST_1411 [Fusarium austroamericanum]|uniref:Arrestin-like N-terminal domain-containing protein n=1 Tax=Fusarium austroamericanum TaxID=282268 RepID=A0AAN6HJW7_FUSAU|nr:hypothetical protein FAUST_1411 [Fusarium austroamericanum]